MKGVIFGETEDGKEKCLVTVHVEKGGVFSHSSLVLSIARVVASMSRFDSVDSEHANFLAISRYDNSIVCA